YIFDAFSFQPEHRAGLSAGRDFDAGTTIQSGHFNFGAQRGLNDADGHFAQQVVTITLKDLVRTNVNDDIEVPGRPAAEAGLAFAHRAPPGTRVHPRRDPQIDF